MSACTAGTMTTFRKSGQLAIGILASVLTLAHARANPGEIEERCRKESNVPQSDIEKYRNLELPQTREGKCYGACVMKAVNMMNSRGKIDEKVSEELASRYVEDVNQLKTVDSKVQSCARRANMGKDMCETAYQYMKCAERHSRSKSTRGLSIPLPEILLTIPPVNLVLLQLGG